MLLGISKSISAATRETAFVSRVIDGDTIVLQDGRKVRYIGVDTPETVHPNKEIGCFGQQASDKNKQLVLGKTVELEKYVSDTDRYGRLLRYVYLDGVMINEKLVAEGYATVVTYPPDVKYKDTFLAAQANARQAKLGLWSDVCADGSVPETTKKQKNAASASTKNNNAVVTTTPIPATVTTQSNTTNDARQCPSNCTQAREMGMTNMTPGHPCWQDKFDRDKDDIGCEQ